MFALGEKYSNNKGNSKSNFKKTSQTSLKVIFLFEVVNLLD